MTVQKDFKRLVRSRMQKTGESYTAARAQLLARPGSRTSRAAAAADGAYGRAGVQVAPAADFAALAGMSDAAVKKATGCTWDRWVWALDKVKAHEWPHRAIAEYVHEKYQVPGWWTQTVTVGYERIRGLREIGQRRGGSYEAGRSRTFAVPVGRLYRAFAEPRTRRRWLEADGLTVRTATKDRSMRITWADGTSVELWFSAKGPGKAAVAVQHTRLASREATLTSKAYWGAQLDELAELLQPPARSGARRLKPPLGRRTAAKAASKS
jgi:hypothetical protein